MLVDKLKEYLDQAEVVKTLNGDLRDLTQAAEEYPEIEKINKELKNLRSKLAQATEVAATKEKRDSAKERLGLLKDILLAEMTEAGETEVSWEGKKAKLFSAMRLEKQ